MPRVNLIDAKTVTASSFVENADFSAKAYGTKA